MGELYLLTGAAGHLGTALVKLLKEKHKKIRALVLPEEKHLSQLSGEDIEIVYGDIRSKKSLEPFFQNPDHQELIVVHMAGIVSISSGHLQAVSDVNVGGTKNIVELCKKHRVKRLIYVSSVHAIPELPLGQTIREISQFDPSSVIGLYAKTKAAASQIVLNAVNVPPE